MASIGENYKVIGILLDHDGYYPGDPQALQLSSYHNQWGEQTFHIAYNQRDIDDLMIYTVMDIKILWTRSGSLTLEGRRILRKYYQYYNPIGKNNAT
jgi:hypothetical protein